MKFNYVFMPNFLLTPVCWQSRSVTICIYTLLLVATTRLVWGVDYQLYTDVGAQTNGLTGSYVNQNLRTAPPQPDWRTTYSISGTRVDPQISFDTLTWDNLAAVGITGGFDPNFGWENFSVQWDGYVKILTNDVMLATQSDDSSRMWIDVNQDGVFSSSSDELMNNNWGTSQAETVGAFSPALAPGVYRIRIQYQEDYFGNSMKLVSDRVGSYNDFNGNRHYLEELRGKYTRLLLTKEDLNTMSLPQARELLDQQDILYAQLKELTGGEPAGDGLLTVAFVETCGAGCGNVGAKGVEIDPDFASKSTAETYDFVAHEMTHNFDTLGAYFFCGNDTSHSWTAWIQNYLDVATLHSSGARSPEKYQAFRVKELFTHPYLSVAGHSWDTCVKSNAYCGGLDTHLIQAGFCHKVAALHGVAAVQRALGFIRTAIVSRNLSPNAMSPEQRNDLMLEAFSFGAQTNLTCYADSWNWAISSTLRNNLATLYGNNNTLCADADGDGFSIIQGDPNDSNPAVHPGAVETVNGQDDDGNGVVDELALSEGAGFPNSPASSLAVTPPIRIQGNGSTANADFFHLDLTNQTSVELEITSLDGGSGWFRIDASNGIRKFEDFIPQTGKLIGAVSLDRGRYEFHIDVNSGRYDALISTSPAWPPYDFAPKPQQISTNQWLLTAVAIPSNLTNRTDVSLRLWVSNQGWIATNIVTSTNLNSVSLTWATPTNFNAYSDTFRCQFFTNNIAATTLTEARGFNPQVMADQFSFKTNGFRVRFAGHRSAKAIQWESQDLVLWTATKTNQPFLNVWNTTNSAAGQRGFFRVTIGD